MEVIGAGSYGCTGAGIEAAGPDAGYRGSYLGKEPKRARAVEFIQQSRPNAVKHNAKSTANNGLIAIAKQAFQQAATRPRRVSKCQMRPQIVIVPIVVARFSVGCPGQIIGEERVRNRGTTG